MHRVYVSAVTLDKTAAHFLSLCTYAVWNFQIQEDIDLGPNNISHHYMLKAFNHCELSDEEEIHSY